MMKHLGLMGLAASAVFAVTMACGGEGTGTDITCATDQDCRVGEICHPDALVCVQTCTSGDECPDSSKNCDFLTSTGGADGGTGSGTKICKCATTTLCQGGPAGADSVCQDAYDVCTPPCATDTDCAVGDTCDTATGQCKAGTGGGTCTPACTGNQVCGANNTCVDKCDWTSCGSGTVCNETSGLCETAATCSSSNQQPDTCSYGQYCSGSSCAYVPQVTAASCQNYTGKPELNWTPATGTGPVIYSVTKVATDWACNAGTDTPLTAEIKAYQPAGGTFPMGNATAIQGLFYVQVNGTELDATNLMKPSHYVRSADGKQATMKVSFCFPTSQNQVQVGLHFENGNPTCTDLQR